MILKNETLTLPEGQFTTEIMQFENSDKELLFKIYNDWRQLCNNLSLVGARGVNLPEGLSESAFCIEMNAVRTTNGIKGKVNTSFDAYDLITKKRIQVKACSVLPDLTSFGPKSVWDQIYFVDFYRQGNWDGTFDIYLIDTNDIYNFKVNATETMRQQQQQKRRPRFSIYKGIIEAKELKPVKTGDLSK